MTGFLIFCAIIYYIWLLGKKREEIPTIDFIICIILPFFFTWGIIVADLALYFKVILSLLAYYIIVSYLEDA